MSGHQRARQPDPVNTPASRTDDQAVADRLRTAPFEPLGRFADASNATLLVRLTDRDPRSLGALVEDLGRDPGVEDLDPQDLAVYKPQRGEAPLWDYPAGTLHRREVAAYEVSAALGWGIVPVTVLRTDAPFGVGSLQRFVPHDLDEHYFRLVEAGGPVIRAQLARLAVFDLLIENGDRKGGHVLLERTVPAPEAQTHGGSARDDVADDAGPQLAPGRVRGVDHGLSFHPESKLRTVVWDLAGEPIDPQLRVDVAGLDAAVDGPLGAQLATLLASRELVRLRERIQRVAALTVLPAPRGPASYPWPPL